MRYTKIYPDGTVTLDSAQFNVAQEVIDGNIRNSEPIKAAVERLRELEDHEEPKKPIKTKRKDIITGIYDCYCPTCERWLPYDYQYRCWCGQLIDWNDEL